MSQLFKKAAAEAAPPIADAECANGAIQRVDTVGREVSVLLPTGVAVFDVPTDCPVHLRGEPIKLRLLQPRDHVRVTFSDRQGRLVAQFLEAQPDTSLARSQL